MTPSRKVPAQRVGPGLPASTKFGLDGLIPGGDGVGESSLFSQLRPLPLFVTGKSNWLAAVCRGESLRGDAKPATHKQGRFTVTGCTLID